MLLFTIVFGALGLHHFYLRSPQTGFLFLIFNTLSLGFWYFFDIIQLATKDNEELNSYGLDIPWWGPAGIAQGMWKCKSTEQGEGPAPPNPLWFLAYMITLPLLPLSRAIAGDIQNSFIAVLNLTYIPFGWMMNWLQVLYDFFNVIVFPGEIFYGGLKRAFPFTLIGWDKDGHSENITGLRELGNLCGEKDNVFVRLGRVLLEVFLAFMPSSLFQGLRMALAKGEETVQGAVQKVTDLKDNFVEEVTDAAVVVKDKAVEKASEAADVVVAVAKEAEPYVEVATGAAKRAAKVLGGVAVEAAIATAETTAKTAAAVADKAIGMATTGYKVATTVGKLATDVPKAVAKGMLSVGQKVAEAKADALREKAAKLASPVTNIASSVTNAVSPVSNLASPLGALKQIPKVSEAVKAASLQMGGGRQEMNMKDALAIGAIAALVGGAVFLRAGRSFFDAVHATTGATDAPPTAYAGGV